MTNLSLARRHFVTFALLCSGALVGCGDAVVDGEWPGEPLYRIEGWVSLDLRAGAIPQNADAGELRIGVFWTPKKGATTDFAASVEQEVETTGTFPARYVVNLYAPPDDSLLTDGYAVGLVLAYLDEDGDGHWDATYERLVGGAPQKVIVYTKSWHPGEFGSIDPGFSNFVAAPCPEGYRGPAKFEPDVPIDMDLVVNMAFPLDMLADLDCDGTKGEWTGVCPPPGAIRERCGPDLADPTMCASCMGRLAPEGADPATCDAWFVDCVALGTNPPECEAEWHLCRGEKPGDNPFECADRDLECTCKRVYNDCLDAGYGHDVCGPKYEICHTT